MRPAINLRQCVHVSMLLVLVLLLLQDLVTDHLQLASKLTEKQERVQGEKAGKGAGGKGYDESMKVLVLHVYTFPPAPSPEQIKPYKYMHT